MTTEKTGNKTALLCAGGTGGHLFPAQALASELTRRGYDVHLVADDRVEKFAADFPCVARHSVPSATPSGKNPIAFVKALRALFKGYLAARRLINEVRPDVAIGFGGYPTVPPMMAAATKGVPTLIHEANAVLGRANSFLSGRVKVVALGTPVRGTKPARSIYTGNPVRDMVHVAAKKTYTPSVDGKPFHLTVFGGSQGAQFFSAATLKAVGLLADELRARLRVTQQARPEDHEAVRSAYQVMDIEADVQTFFANMPDLIADSHLVISRSGASTVAELSAIGRPSILVPYPHALDHDQAANAAALEANGGAFVKKQSDVTPEWLASELSKLMNDPDGLANMAEKARAQGKLDAATTLADAVEGLVTPV